MRLKIIYTDHFPVKGFRALTVWPCVFVRKDCANRFTETGERHETTHALQQIEMLVVGVVLAVTLLCCGYGWYSLIPIPLFFELYLVNMEKEERKVYDFTKVNVEVEFDIYEEMDLSKAVANAVHKSTDDLGLDELARDLFRNGKVSLTEGERKIFDMVITSTRLVAAAKRAVHDLLNK